MDFPINMSGNLTANAIKGASAVDTLTAALKAEERVLKAAEVAGARLKAAGEISVKPFKAAVQARANIGALKAQLADMKIPEVKTGFFATLEKSRGPIGGLVKDAKAMGGAFAGNKWAMAAVGILAVTTAVVTLSKAIVTGSYDAGVYALKLADAGRSARILNDAADIAGGTHSQLTTVIKEAAEASTLGKDRIGAMARELRILRFDSRQTQLTVSAMAVAESALGQGASGAIKGIAEQSRASRRFVLGARDLYGEYTALAGTGLGKKDVFSALAKQLNVTVGEAENRFRRGGVSVRQGLEAIETATKAKFGGTVEKQLLSLDTQFGKLREDIGTLFGGVNIDPFLKGLKKITGISSDTTAGGRATRLAITAALDDLAGKAAKVFPYVESFLYGFGTGAMNVYNESIKPLLDSFSTDVETGGLEGSFNAGETAAKALANTLAEMLKTINSIVVSAGKIGKFASVFNPIVQKGTGGQRFAAVKEYVTGGQGETAGANVSKGVASGVKAGTSTAVDAMIEMSRQMQEAFASANKMHSPSKLYEEEALFIPAGAARGVRRGTSDVQEAISDMAAPPAMGAPAHGSSAMSGSFTASLALDLRWPSGEVTREIHNVLFRAAEGGPRPAVR